MPRLFRTRPWHLPGALAALLALVLGAVTGGVVLHGAASAAPTGPSITLSQSTDLVNQRITVSWSGFLPNQFALGIYQCKGTVPTAKDCDGVNDLRPDPDKPGGVPGPVIGHQARYGMTGSAGQASFHVMPKADRPYLGCDEDSPCVVAVVMRAAATATKDDFRPANVSFASAGANMPLDKDFTLALDVGQAAYAPVSFSPEPSSCTANRAALRVNGNSEHATAGLSWLGALCRRTTAPMTMTVSASSSQDGRDAFRSGLFDAAITSQPLGGPVDQALGAQPSTLPGRKPDEVAYAPLTNSAIVVAMNVDRMSADGTRLEVVEPFNLPPRLVAKLVTNAYGTSARYATGSRPGLEVPGLPPQYVHSLYDDPEFLAANPGRTFPDLDLHPVVIRGVNDDTIHELSRWLLADPGTRDWLGGKADETGIACPDVWRTNAVTYPFSLVVNRLEESELSYRPVSSYWTIVDNLENAQGPEVRDQGQAGTPDLKPIAPDAFGAHRVLAITSLEAATRMQLSVAKLRNAAGQFVAPTTASVTAGVAAATPGPDGVTLSNDFASKDPAVYPLVTTDVAVVPGKNLTQPTRWTPTSPTPPATARSPAPASANCRPDTCR
ncbi:MAG: hypothetical protein HOV68_18865 [Streptomycetaceae bacterium]|nr:hypothetical protein [Streptomycetaceae bacterium]